MTTGTLITIDASPLGSAISLAKFSVGKQNVKLQKSRFEETLVEDSSASSPFAGHSGSGTKQASFDFFIDFCVLKR